MVLLSIKLNMIFNLEVKKMPTIPRDDIVGISYIYIKTMRIV